MTTISLRNKVIFITGASRGIGRAIALRFAKEGARIVIAAKSAEPHPTLEGTIFTVADEVDKAGGQAFPLALDVRDEKRIEEAVDQTIKRFGGIDILVNNASAINLSNTLNMPMKRFDLISAVNARATFMCSKFCLPYLKNAENPHILNLSPPLSMKPRWFKKHVAYTISKYGMSLCTLGLSQEYKQEGVAVNSLWPRTLIATAAVAVHISRLLYHASRKPDIMADAAYEIVTSNSREVTGNFFIDEKILKERGVRQFKQYAMHRFVPVIPDIFVD